MTALYVFLGIILFFVVVFSLKVTLIVDYGEKTVVTLQYLFLKIPILDTSKPKKEKKPKKPKKEKTKKDKTENGDAEAQTDAADTQTDAVGQTDKNGEKAKKQKPAGNSLIKQLYIEQGYDGLVRMLSAVGSSLGGFFGKIYKSFTIDELYITMVTAGSDASDTALKHGKLCSYAYPILGKIISTCKVKAYDFDFSPDFLAQKSKADAHVRFHIIPIKITNGAIVLALQLVFKVLIKILFAKKKSDSSKKKAVSEATSEIIAENSTDTNSVSDIIETNEVSKSNGK